MPCSNGSNQSAAATGGTLERTTNQRQLQAGHWKEQPISGSYTAATLPVSQWIKIEKSSSILKSKRRNYLHIQQDSEEVLKSVENNTIRRSLKLLAFLGACVYFLMVQYVCSHVISAFELERSQMEGVCETKL